MSMVVRRGKKGLKKERKRVTADKKEPEKKKEGEWKRGGKATEE